MTIIPIYGIQVCPFIEGLSPVGIAMPVISLFALQYLIGIPLWSKLIPEKPLEKQVKVAFTVEAMLFISTGILLSPFNTIVFDFPLESGLKLIVGIIGLGFFAVTDLALEAERNVADKVSRDGDDIDPEIDYFPLTTKIAMFATACVLLVVGVFILLVIKDLDWIVEVGESIPLSDGRISII